MYQGVSPLTIFVIIMAGFATSMVLSLVLALVAESRPRWGNPLLRISRARTRIFLVPQTVSRHRNA
jgi:hypothetical protein